MNYIDRLKKIGTAFGYFLISFVGFIIIITTLYYFDIISSKTYNILEIIGTLISCLIAGIKIGKYSKQKGWLGGLKLGLLITLLCFLFTIFGSSMRVSMQSIIYFIVIIIITIFGSMMGINKKKEAN